MITDETDEISIRLRAYEQEFRAELRNVMTARQYAAQIVELVQTVMSLSSQTALWIERCGLLYCVIDFPSSLFAIPVRCRFKTDHWTSGGETAARWELDERPMAPRSRSALPFAKGFFSYDILAGGDCHIEFATWLPLYRRLPRSHNKQHRTLVVDLHFLSYLDDTFRDDAPNIERNDLLIDARYEAFKRSNSEAIKEIFDIRGWYTATGPECIAAIDELRETVFQRDNQAQNVYVLAEEAYGTSPGAMCFAFQEEVPPDLRKALRLLADRVFRFLRTTDVSEHRRRIAIQFDGIALAHSEVHTLRNLMGAISNKLMTISARNATTPIDRGLPERIDDIINLHADAIFRLDQIETLLIDGPKMQSHVITVEHFAAQCRKQWVHPCESVDIRFHESKNCQFELSSSADDLIDSLFQFVEGAMNEHAWKAITLEDDPERPTVEQVIAWIGVNELRSELHIGITVRSPMPESIVAAVRQLTIFDRLPSEKIGGGRGLLSAIGMIRNRYSGTIELLDAWWLGTRWQIRVPVGVSKQGSLFTSG